MVDAGGTVTGERRCLAYGGTRAISGTVPTRCGFAGQREEGALGPYFCDSRWYDPVPVQLRLILRVWSWIWPRVSTERLDPEEGGLDDE